MSDGPSIRKLWELIEKEQLIHVLQVVQGPQWTLLVSVPWCRFAREVRTEAQYRELLAKLKRHPEAPPEVKSDETQLSLF